MSEKLTVADWIEKSIPIHPGSPKLRLYPYQRAILERMGKPDVVTFNLTRPTRIQSSVEGVWPRCYPLPGHDRGA